MPQQDSTPRSVILREVIEADLPIFFEHQRDPHATRMAAFTSRDRDAFGAHWKKILADDGVAKRTILADGVVAGNVVCWEKDGRREVGYWIGREHWGRGIATQGLGQLLRVVAERPLHAHVAKFNVASIRVLEKCGFKIVGEDRCPSETGGEAVDEFIMTLE